VTDKFGMGSLGMGPLAGVLDSMEFVKQAWSTQGDWDCCLVLNIWEHDKLEEFVWKHVRTNEWVDATRTMWSKQWW